MTIKRKKLHLALLAVLAVPTSAQRPPASQGERLLTLDSCRALALRNNKSVRMAAVRQTVAADLRRSARTKYLPRVSAVGLYEHSSKEVSLLSDGQKAALGRLGTTVTSGIQQLTGLDAASMAGLLDDKGQNLADALRTDTRNMFGGSVMLTQPVYMGGAIVAANRMADLSEALAAHQAEAKQQETLYSVEQTYWQVVSLMHKKELAESYLRLVSQLESDVRKMTGEGVATRSDLLSVSVKVNEAEMNVTKVSDGLVLQKMLLCQQIGWPLDTDFTLADERLADGPVVMERGRGEARPELRALGDVVDMSRQATGILKAGNLPQVLLTGGYMVSNPNVLNGFEKKFGGFWSVGVMARVPLWNWGDVKYKVRASKGATAIACLEQEEAREMIELQVNQSTFRVEEAGKKLAMARSNIQHADENLRTANLGFREGVVSTTAVMEAQTAWLQARSQEIDAEIDVRLSRTELRKSLGTLTIDY